MIGTAFAVFLGSGLYGFLIEPYWVETTRHRVEVPIRPPLKIAHLTDLHTRGLGRRERKILSLLEREKPDLIAITGDTLEARGTYEMCRPLLERLRAPLGVFLVRGNWENWHPLEGEEEFFRSVGVRFLLNSREEVREGIWVVGLDDGYSGSPDLKAALKGVPTDAFTIILTHSPAFFDRVAGHCDLVLAGHTHGGQFRLPFFGPLWSPAGSGGFLQGWHEVRGTRMYVSRGLGTSVLGVRFLCRPELAIITLGDGTGM